MYYIIRCSTGLPSYDSVHGTLGGVRGVAGREGQGPHNLLFHSMQYSMWGKHKCCVHKHRGGRNRKLSTIYHRLISLTADRQFSLALRWRSGGGGGNPDPVQPAWHPSRSNLTAGRCGRWRRNRCPSLSPAPVQGPVILVLFSFFLVIRKNVLSVQYCLQDCAPSKSVSFTELNDRQYRRGCTMPV